MSNIFSTLVDLLCWRAEHQPERRAYTFLTDGAAQESTLTYGELDRAARTIGAFLQANAAPGQRVILLYPPGLEYITAFFGCLYAGAIAVPAYPPQANRPAPRLQAIARDAQATIALTTPQILATSEQRFAHAPELATLAWHVTADLMLDRGERWQAPALTGDTLAFLQYTSGSTAAPKGVMLSHRNLLHNSALIQRCFGHTSESRGLIWLPPYHDMGLIGGIIQPLYSGFPVTLMAPISFLQRPIRWLQALTRYGATTSGGPNFAFDLCVQRITPDQCAGLDLSHWQVAFTGAEPIRADTIARFTAAFAPWGFRPEAWYPCYGLAEATLIAAGGTALTPPTVRAFRSAALERHQAVAATAADAQVQLVGCGRALDDQQIKVVDPERLRPCATGQVGEIWLAGPSIAGGYWDNAAETEAAFGARLADTGEGPFLRTGDLGFVADGQLFITGRLKDVIIIRGRNIYPQDIEAGAAQSHPALPLDAAAAFGVEADGEERLVIVQEIGRRHRHAPLDEMLQAIRQAIVVQYDVAVHDVVLIRPGSLPKTSSNKVQRRACRAQYLAGTLEVLARSRVEAAAVAPGAADSPGPSLTAAQIRAAAAATRGALLRDDLRYRVGRLLRLGESIPLDQPLSLDSLAAVSLKNQIEADFGVVLPLSDLLDVPGIDQLAERLERLLIAPEHAAPALTPQADAPRHPLSHGQRGIYFLQQLAPDSAAYTIARAIRICSELDRSALQRAFQVLVDRHPALRATVIAEGGYPMAQTQAAMPGLFLAEDAAAWDEAALAAQLGHAAHTPFDLARGPLLRVHLFSRAAHDHVLLLTIHHIIADMWSLSVLLAELGTIYAAELRGQAAPLPPLSLGYSDFVRWQADLLAGAHGRQLADYWQTQLAGALPVLNLPTDRPRPKVQTFHGARRTIQLDLQITEALHALSQEQRTTPFNVLLTAFAITLARLTGQPELMIGAPVAGRSRAQFAQLVGYFVNTLPLRLDLSGDPTLVALLGRVRQTVLAAFDHQDYPFDLLVERLHLQRDAGQSPLVQAMFVMQTMSLLHDQDLAPFALNIDGGSLVLGDLTVESLAVEQRAAQFDLTLMAAEVDRRWNLALQYNSDLFDADTIDRWLRHFATVVATLAHDGARRLSHTSLLSAAERQQIVGGWNERRVVFPGDLAIHQLIEAQAQRTPQRVAVRYDDQTLTYAALNRRANQLAHRLRRQHVTADARVGICMERSLELVIGLLAILKAGAAYVPLDPGYPAERLNFMLQDAQLSVLLTLERLAPLLSAHRATLLCVDAAWPALDAEPTHDPQAPIDGDNAAYMIYTSGSTGRPKGAINTHRGISNRLQWMQAEYGLTADDRVLQKTPTSFDVSVWEFFWPLLAGAELVLARPGGHHDPSYLIELIVQQQITTLHFVPSMLQMFLSEPGVERCTTIKRVLCSGEMLPADLVERFAKRLPASLHNLYGPTEAAIDVTFWACSPALRARSVPIGRPVANTSIYILDHALQPAPIGVAGELYIGGVQLARGYHQRPALTAERFIPNPFAGADGDLALGASRDSADPQPLASRLYKTGDQARFLPDGTIEFLGRLDHQIKIRGFRVELEEIDAVLRQHPAVHDSAVIASGQPGAAGVQEQRLVGYIVPHHGQQLTTTALRRWLKTTLPDYMIPSDFVLLAQLPLMVNGKLDRKALPEPSDARPQLEVAFLPARTAEEHALTQVWAEVLGRDQIGIDDNFFELGGDSIRSLQVLARLREHGLSCSLPELFVHQTIRELAGALSSAAPAETAAAAPFALVSPGDRPKIPPDRVDAYPLSMLQAGLIFHSEYSHDYEIYVTSLHLRAPCEVELLRSALSLVIARHPMLRTSFDTTSYSQPLQIVHRAVDVPLSVVDLCGQAPAEQDRQISAWVQGEKKRAFVWDQPPLVRFSVHRRSAATFQFTLSEPLLDGWSVARLLTEIFQTYLALLDGASPEPTPLASSFGDFIRLEQAALASEACRAFWERLLESPSVTVLPRLRTAPLDGPARIERLTVAIPQAISDGLKQLARLTSTPLKSVLLAVHLKVMAFLGGQADVLTGLLANGRPEQADGEKILGIFLNPIPFRLTLSPMSWIELARRAFALECEMLPFRRFPIAELQRTHGGRPLFETVFNFTHFHAYDGIQALAGIDVLDGYASEQTFFPLTTQFNLDHGGSGRVRLALDYNVSELAEAQVVAIGEYYLRVMAALVAAPEERHDLLVLLSERERRQMVEDWNATDADYPRAATLHALVEAQAARTPNAIAVVDAGGSLSYTELDARANQLAHLLQAHGVGPDVCVGVCQPRSLDLIVTLLGVLKAGGAYLPLDPAFPSARRSFILEHARAPLLLTRATQPLDLPLPASITVIELDTLAPLIDTYPATAPLSRATPGHLSYVIYTSGSTGQPKGVEISHAALVNFLAAMQQRPGLRSDDVLLAVTTVAFDIAGLELFLPLISGARVVLAPQTIASDGEQLLALLRRSGATVMQATPTTWRLLLEAGWSGTPSLTMLCGGEAFPIDLAARLLPLGGALWNMYGPTETTIWSTAHRVMAEPGAIPIGRPIANTQVYVLDAQMQPTPVGVIGELLIGGVGLARGYHRQPALTAERFVPDPFSVEPGARLYCTGDLARWREDGLLECLGRADQQIKLRGFRIELGEIEAVLAQQPEVGEVVAAVRPGPAGPQLVAYVVARAGAQLRSAELRAAAQQVLPEYMVPSSIVMLPALPRTPSGKIDRSTLPSPAGAERDAPYQAPRTALEQQIAQVWSDVLNLDRISVHDHFFGLGGHSLLAMRVVSRLRLAVDLDLPLALLFEAPTIAGLAERIEARQAQADADDLAWIIAQVEQYSEEEARQKLAEKGWSYTLGSTEGP